ncbi:MAG: oligosaccharide flippase family protein [Ktedonobacteraceae bacterium]|nr:oligosaccharide flippase family protein [Ktedonobacteraceae bacterium]
MKTLLYQQAKNNRVVKVSLYQVAKNNIVMFINAASLVGTTAVTSALGFVYWGLTARMFPLKAVGLASVSISTMMLLGTFCLLGLGTLLIGELPQQPGKEGALISAALLLVGGVGVCVGGAFAMIAPLLSPELRGLGTSPVDVLLFALGVSLTAMGLVLDQALIGLLRGELQLWRNLLVSAIKVVAIFALSFWASQATGLAIYTTWTIANLFSLLALTGFALAKGKLPTGIFHPHWGLLRKLGPAALRHHILNLTLQAPVQILPMMVTIMLSTEMNAKFYMAMNISTLVTIIPVALTTVLHAEGSLRPAMLTRKIRLTLSLTFLASVGAIAVLWPGAPLILGLFGHSYAQDAAWGLRILALEAFPVMIRNHYVSVRRIQGQVGRAIPLIIAVGAFQLLGAAVGAHYGGMTGLCLGWLAVDCIGALFMIPGVYRVALPAAGSEQVLSTRDALEEDYASGFDRRITRKLPRILISENFYVGDPDDQITMRLPARLAEQRIHTGSFEHLDTLKLAEASIGRRAYISNLERLDTLKLAIPLPESPAKQSKERAWREHAGSENPDEQETLKMPNFFAGNDAGTGIEKEDPDEQETEKMPGVLARENKRK